MDTMAAIKETFFQECEEQLGELETGLLAMQEGSNDGEVINAVFRAVHSIKGGAGAFKLDQLVRFAHTFETTLDLIRNNTLEASPATLKVMLRASDQLADLVNAARNGVTCEDQRTIELIDELAALSNKSHDLPNVTGDQVCEENFVFQPIALSLSNIDTSSDVEASPHNKYDIIFSATENLYGSGSETTRLFRELGRLGSLTVFCDASNVPKLDEINPEGAYLTWSLRLCSSADMASVQEVFEFVDGDCQLEIRLSSGLDDNISIDHAEHIPESGTVTSICSGDPEMPALASLEAGDGGSTKNSTPSVNRGEPNDKMERPEGSGQLNFTQPTIRVDLERVDRLINLVGELVINQAMLSQCIFEAGVARGSTVSSGLDALEQLTREIQESVMAIRAQPVKPLFQRMSRIVREIADVTGKDVRLKTEGETTEVDRTVIERLADPLTHMIRNAVDHGLERPEVRTAAGKMAQGEVRLSAVHRSGRIVIEVADDGAGINRARVKGIAIKKGLIPPDAQLSDGEIDNLLFLPGFSTAEAISNISGRGVGMDVVKRSIQALGGRISITSKPGIGSIFSMSLPLTLAVLDGMVVKVADQTLVVPLTAIVETLKPNQKGVHALGLDANVIASRGGFVPLVDVGRELGYRSMTMDPLNGVALLVETEGGSRCALLVDGIQDQRQVVIKSLESNYGHVQGIAAATILGDGRIALILDVDALIGRTDRHSRGAAQAAVGY